MIEVNRTSMIDLTEADEVAPGLPDKISENDLKVNYKKPYGYNPLRFYLKYGEFIGEINFPYDKEPAWVKITVHTIRSEPYSYAYYYWKRNQFHFKERKVPRDIYRRPVGRLPREFFR